MRERRFAPRIPLRAKFEATVITGDSSSKKETCAGWTQDASAGGLNVRARRELPLHCRVDLDLHCTHPIEEMRIHGFVSWVRKDAVQTYVIDIFLDPKHKDDLVAWRRMLVRPGLKM